MLLYAAPQVITDTGQLAAALASMLGFLVLLWQIVRRTIVSVVEPKFADAKAAAKAQHDEQNEVLEAQNETIEAIRTEVTRARTEVGDLRADVGELSTQLGTIEVRLNTGSDRFAVHEYRLEALESPHPPKDEPA